MGGRRQHQHDNYLQSAALRGECRTSYLFTLEVLRFQNCEKFADTEELKLRDKVRLTYLN